MKIEAGKYYKTRDGRKVGPIEKGEQWELGPWYFKFGENHYERNGHSCYGGRGSNHRHEDDLTSEWQDESTSPIRTVTRREIVNGTYGRLYIERSNTSKRVGIDITGDDEKLSYLGEIAYLDATELREAAHILNQIAEFLEENGNA